MAVSTPAPEDRADPAPRHRLGRIFADTPLIATILRALATVLLVSILGFLYGWYHYGDPAVALRKGISYSVSCILSPVTELVDGIEGPPDRTQFWNEIERIDRQLTQPTAPAATAPPIDK
jgi:hypothetical protein